MSNSGNVDPGAQKDVSMAGSSTDQHVSGAAETGTFTTDQAPTDDTPSHGSSNAGINATRANRTESPDGGSSDE
jgi:hypothetical protein